MTGGMLEGRLTGTGGPHPSVALAIASAGTGLVLLVFATVVATVAPTVSALHSGASGQTWALSGMSLGLATMLLSLGAISDDYGYRRVFWLSAAVLAAASVLAAIAPDIEVFVAARILQGGAGAGVIASSLGLIGHTFPEGPHRTRATGVWGAAVGAGTALGPLIAASLALLGGWRAGYWFQAGAAALLVPAATVLGGTRADTRRRIDRLGLTLFAGAMASLVAGVTLGRHGWGRPLTLMLLLASLILLISFVAVEQRQREPMIELALFRRPLFLASASGALFVGMAVVAVVSFLPTFLQRAQHRSPLAAAAILAEFSLSGTIVAFHARRLPNRLDSGRRVAIGFVCGALGLVAISDLPVHAGWVRLAPGLLLLGTGYGMTNAALGRLAVESVPRSQTGMGSGANNTARYVGGAVGVAIIAALLAAGNDRPGVVGLIHGWNLAAGVAAALCLLGAGVALVCRRER